MNFDLAYYFVLITVLTVGLVSLLIILCGFSHCLVIRFGYSSLHTWFLVSHCVFVIGIVFYLIP